ncbi:hypothetical protein EG68_12513 [Paragonimus skrjabini miyazakii]|uniref:PB1 domain-containing protein n=1 Tax=Paragonimus skrjabini miyazakii TaxID=59628 RepID=A0A8S9YG01_9TREM|nr:hypothetical protein EG68_12513 [Paragonimus skrjabini miyazakii]
MPSFKITIPSTRTDSGQEVTRWNVKQPKDQITYRMLTERLRAIIDTPTTGYIVTWTDDNDLNVIHNTVDLHKAIDYFEKKQLPDRCVRLKAEPQDTLDLLSALEILETENQGFKSQQPTATDSDEFQMVDIEQRNSDREEQKTNKAIVEQKTKIKDAMAQTECFLLSGLNVQAGMSKKLTVHVGESISIPPQYPFDKDNKPSCDMARCRMTSNQSPATSSLSMGTSEVEIQKYITGETDFTGPVSKSTNPTLNVGQHGTDLPGGISLNDNATNLKLSKQSVSDLARKLYIMGFRFEEKVLRRTIRECKGDMNMIIDKLSSLERK